MFGHSVLSAVSSVFIGWLSDDNFVYAVSYFVFYYVAIFLYCS